MRELNKWVSKKYAYVKDDVIFKIDEYNNGDSCVVEISETTSPKFTVDGETYYLNSYIEVGDKHTEADGFIKTVHGNMEDPTETSISYAEYYFKECEKEIQNTVTFSNGRTYEEFKNNPEMLGVPTFMIKGDNVVEGMQQIDFTEEYYNSSKEEKVKELIADNASITADKYGYNLDSITTTISKIEA